MQKSNSAVAHVICAPKIEENKLSKHIYDDLNFFVIFFTLRDRTRNAALYFLFHARREAASLSPKVQRVCNFPTRIEATVIAQVRSQCFDRRRPSDGFISNCENRFVCELNGCIVAWTEGY